MHRSRKTTTEPWEAGVGAGRPHVVQELTVAGRPGCPGGVVASIMATTCGAKIGTEKPLWDQKPQRTHHRIRATRAASEIRAVGVGREQDDDNQAGDPTERTADGRDQRTGRCEKKCCRAVMESSQ